MIDLGLTVKQRKWLDLYIETGNATEAAFKAYKCKDRASAGNIGYENVKKLDFGDLMDKMGISDIKLSRKLEEGLDATRVVSAIIVGKTADERTNDFVEVPDYPTRHKYLETGLKIKSRIPDNKKVELTGKDGQPIEIATDLTPEQKNDLSLRVAEIYKEIYGKPKLG